MYGVNIFPYVIAFALALSVTFADYVTSNFPGTLCLALKNRWLFIYACVYGLFGIVGFVAYPELFGANNAAASTAVKATTFSMQNPWMRAATIGLTIKTVMHLKFFEIPSGAGSATPVGIATFLQPFEPLLVRAIKLEHWNLLTALMSTAAAKYPTLTVALPLALAGIPGSLTPAEKAAMAADLNAAKAVNDLFQVYISYAGCSLFKKTFP